jgi:hypothetical protein
MMRRLPRMRKRQVFQMTARRHRSKFRS